MQEAGRVEGSGKSKAEFTAYELRCLDPAAAEAFYVELLGAVDPSRIAFESLNEKERLLGVPAHWLGIVEVDDAEATTRAMVERGAQTLGVPREGAWGRSVHKMRDAEGAVFGLMDARASEPSAPSRVQWHALLSRDGAKTWPAYAQVLGWICGEEQAVVPAAIAPYEFFRADPAAAFTGALCNAARLPGTHPHWLFHFAVDDMDAALVTLRGAGGRITAPPMPGPIGARICMAEDPQGAALAFWADACAGTKGPHG